ncbi:MAG: DinB family protein [Acidimicrobiia bacterium]
MAHPYPPYSADERETLSAYLDYYRAVLRDKAGGLGAAQLNTRLGPSTLTIGGLLHHMAYVEDWWFNQALLGNDPNEPWAAAPWQDDSDWEFTVAADLEPAVILERYDQAVARSQEIQAGIDSLEQLSVRTRDGKHWTLRWIMVHMIEELARHAGHADLIRESIDGEVGDFRDQAG